MQCIYGTYLRSDNIQIFKNYREGKKEDTVLLMDTFEQVCHKYFHPISKKVSTKYFQEQKYIREKNNT